MAAEADAVKWTWGARILAACAAAAACVGVALLFGWIVVVLAELGIAILAGLTFLVLYGLRSHWRDTPLGRHMMAFSAVVVGAVASLLLVGIGVPVPAWVFAGGFGLLDVVLVQRVLLLVRVQEEEEVDG